MRVFTFNKFYSYAKETYNFAQFSPSSTTKMSHDAAVSFILTSFTPIPTHQLN